jgi:hypothetical protein
MQFRATVIVGLDTAHWTATPAGGSGTRKPEGPREGLASSLQAYRRGSFAQEPAGAPIEVAGQLHYFFSRWVYPDFCWAIAGAAVTWQDGRGGGGKKGRKGTTAGRARGQCT